MMTLIEINQAVNNTVKQALNGLFAYDVPLVSEDLKEPIKRPSVKVIFEGVTSGLFNSRCKERSLTCRIYFFAKNGQKPKFENLKVQEALEAAFLEGLVITPAFIVPVDEMESNVSDSVLICGFDIDTLEIMPDTNESELMEDLKLNNFISKEE